MAEILTKTVNSALVTYDNDYRNRWLDAVGGGVVKYAMQAGIPTDDTTGDPTQFTMTVTEAGTGSTTAVNSTTAGEQLLITTADNEYDGINLQLKGEKYKVVASKPFYFGCKFKVSDATQSDIFIGLAETDTTLMATSSAHAIALGGDGLFFSKLDASTTLAAKAYLDGSETASADYETALADGTYVTVEIYYDGGIVYYYIDDNLVGIATASLPDGDMTPSINFRAGAVAAKTLHIAEMRCIQCR